MSIWLQLWAMPKKSKKQKIKALQHFQSQLLRPKIILPSVSPVANQKSTDMVIPVQNKQEIITSHYFLKDFKKSIILILGIIALEIFFYFASMRSDWFKLFKF